MTLVRLWYAEMQPEVTVGSSESTVTVVYNGKTHEIQLKEGTNKNWYQVGVSDIMKKLSIYFFENKMKVNAYLGIMKHGVQTKMFPVIEYDDTATLNLSNPIFGDFKEIEHFGNANDNITFQLDTKVVGATTIKVTKKSHIDVWSEMVYEFDSLNDVWKVRKTNPSSGLDLSQGNALLNQDDTITFMETGLNARSTYSYQIDWYDINGINIKSISRRSKTLDSANTEVKFKAPSINHILGHIVDVAIKVDVNTSDVDRVFLNSNGSRVLYTKNAELNSYNVLSTTRYKIQNMVNMGEIYPSTEKDLMLAYDSVNSIVRFVDTTKQLSDQVDSNIINVEQDVTHVVSSPTLKYTLLKSVGENNYKLRENYNETMDAYSQVGSLQDTVVLSIDDSKRVIMHDFENTNDGNCRVLLNDINEGLTYHISYLKENPVSMFADPVHETSKYTGLIHRDNFITNSNSTVVFYSERIEDEPNKLYLFCITNPKNVSMVSGLFDASNTRNIYNFDTIYTTQFELGTVKIYGNMILYTVHDLVTGETMLKYHVVDSWNKIHPFHYVNTTFDDGSGVDWNKTNDTLNFDILIHDKKVMDFDLSKDLSRIVYVRKFQDNIGNEVITKDFKLP